MDAATTLKSDFFSVAVHRIQKLILNHLRLINHSKIPPSKATNFNKLKTGALCFSDYVPFTTTITLSPLSHKDSIRKIK